MSDQNQPPKCPAWVIFSVRGARDRSDIRWLVWLSLAWAAISFSLSPYNAWFISIGVVFLAAGAVRWLAVRWVDAHEAWPPVVSPGPQPLVTRLGCVTCLATVVAFGLFLGLSVRPNNGHNDMYPTTPDREWKWTWDIEFRLINKYMESSWVRRGTVLMSHGHSSRVMALPGERIQIIDKSVVVNGAPLEQRPSRTEENLLFFRETNGDVSYEIVFDQKRTDHSSASVDILVPKNHFFLMGDNRDYAVDSRSFGPASLESLWSFR